MAITINKESRGLYHAYAPEYELELVDPEYSGFRIKYFSKKPTSQYSRGTYGIMDTLSGGVEGILNPVDGKRYDSKSAYHRKLKETGHHVYEGEPSGKKVLNRGDHNVFKELKAAAIQHGL